MRVADDVTGLIGYTPLVRLTRFPVPEGVTVYAKLEFYNPGGSVKDRAGLFMIREAEREGRLCPGGTIIEPTAGNTGIGLAVVAARRGYRVIFTVPAKFSREKQELMRALGAEVVVTPTEEGMAGAVAKAEELAARIPGAFVPNQFRNPANPLAHYRTTGPEIWEQTGGRVSVFVAGCGTGGTFSGAARYLKERNPGLRAVAVEPEGSVLGGGVPGPHLTEGIGMDEVHPIMDVGLADAVRTVSDADAFRMVRELARREGLLVGSSSGAAAWAALAEARGAAPGAAVVVVFPDGGERYLSKDIYRLDLGGTVPGEEPGAVPPAGVGDL